MPLAPGDLLGGRYRIGAQLGAGGAASVFSAQEEPSGAERVVKQLRVDAPEILDSFRDEFALLSRVSHPSLLRVLDFGTALLREQTLHYYVAERLSGSSLMERARRAPPTTELLAPLLDALEGLAALHDNEIRHGDFTPFNVMVDDAGHGTLIDLGCAQPLGRATTIGGTPGFMAPELVERGFADARADLYSVGQTLKRVFELARRSPPDRVQRVLERLTRPNPRDRPSDVREVLEAFKRKPKASSSYLAPTRLLGREPQLEAFASWLRALRRGRAGARVLAVTGVPGAGVTRLSRELTWRAQLEVPVLRALVHEPDSVSRCLALASGLTEPVRSLRDLLPAVARLRGAKQAFLLVVDDYQRLGPEQRVVLEALARTLGHDGQLGLLVSGTASPPGVASEVVTCGALEPKDLWTWASRWLPKRKLPELLARTRGLPKLVEAALRETRRAAAEPAPTLAPSLAVERLGRGAKQALALLAARGTDYEFSGLPVAQEPLGDLLASGLVELDGTSQRLTESAAAAIGEGALSVRELSQAHLRFVEQLQQLPASVEVTSRLIFHATLAGQLARAEQLLLEHQVELARKPAAVVPRLQELLRQSLSPEVLLAGASLLLSGAEPRLALRAAARALRQSPRHAQSATLLSAESLARLGQPARAQALLERLLERSTAPEAKLLDRLARTLLGRGDYDAAKRMAERAVAAAGSADAASLAHETLGVALGYLGLLEPARAELELARAGIASAGTARDRFRITAHAATLSFRSGRIADAITEYGAALAIAEDNELDDLLAMGLLNLGTAEQQAGLWGSALKRYERGIAFARAVGRLDTELTLEFNLANLHAELGAFARAEDALERLEARVDTLKLGHLKLGIQLVKIELWLLRGELAKSQAALLIADRLVEKQGAGREQVEVTLRHVDVLLGAGKLADAERRLDQALSRTDAEVAGELALVVGISRARLLAAQRKPEVIASLELVRAAAQQRGLMALEATATGELFEAAEALGLLDDSRTYRERSRRLWDRVAADLPTHFGEAFWSHPKRRRLNELSQSHAPRGVPGDGAAEIKVYRRLLSLTRRLSSSHSVPQILDYAVQAAVDLTEAERGFLLLKGADGSYESASVVSSSEPFAPERGPSRSIVRRALENEEPVITTDALEDPRFATQRSVHSLQLKSVLCVPVLAASGTLGALYVDSSLQRSHFSPADRELLVAFADQVAIALVNARLREELEQRSKLLEQKNLELESIARGHAQEAEKLREEVSKRRDLSLRYDYSQIVGRGPAMQRVLERLDRLVDSDASLLINGESGTGKELIARAAHFNGPRKDGPFVGINCAALPEALLESELFGHVRGAFTGADRDKRGLLQSARGGTLFLDEIGELPQSVQSRLLRVLQEREVRPLGALTSEPLDIRLVAATHRDLQQEIARGAFREDLYYRIAVVSIELPPLRERLEDLPALAARILEGLGRDSQRKAPTLSHEALRKLSAHGFRGNIRELQNILTRAFVLASGSRLRAEDIELGPATKATAGAGTSRSASRREFQEQERARILEALQQARWNVSAVSSSLGIPRATLHRKLKRYGLERSSVSAASR